MFKLHFQLLLVCDPSILKWNLAKNHWSNTCYDVAFHCTSSVPEKNKLLTIFLCFRTKRYDSAKYNGLDGLVSNDSFCVMIG